MTSNSLLKSYVHVVYEEKKNENIFSADFLFCSRFFLEINIFFENSKFPRANIFDRPKKYFSENFFAIKFVFS